MPNPSHSGILIAPWHHCDCCGFPYRTSELQRQEGFLKCYKCFDMDTVTTDRRRRIADAKISDGQIEADLADILKDPSAGDEGDWF